LLRKVHETGLLDFLQEARDHVYRAAVWCSLEQSLIDGTVDQWRAHSELVFNLNADILNITCDCRFVFSVLDELHVSHHA